MLLLLFCLFLRLEAAAIAAAAEATDAASVPDLRFGLILLPAPPPVRLLLLALGLLLLPVTSGLLLSTVTVFLSRTPEWISDSRRFRSGACLLLLLLLCWTPLVFERLPA